MTRFATLLLLLSGFLLSCRTEPTPPPSPPNIIFLLTDDQRWDAMGAMGNPLIKTPEMDILANQGVMFKNAYVTTPICAVSRASLLSGQYSRRHGIHGFSKFFEPEAWEQTYPIIMRKQGYYTGFIGKFGVGGKETMPAGDFDFWRGIPGQPYYEQTDENGNYKHLTRIMGEQCLEFLDSVDSKQPFCLSVSFKAPHVQDSDPRQFLYDSAYIDLFSDIEIPPARMGEDKWFEAFPDFFKEDNEARRRWEIRFSTPEKYQASVKGYYRLIYGVDVVIGKIREKLEALGQADNTIIVLMGDNGFFLGERGLAGKWYGYEESIRVPLVIYDPRLPQDQRGQIIEQIALNIDLAPTFLGMAGANIPSDMQGRNLEPLYRGGVTEWRNDFLFEHLFEHARIPKSEGVVSLTEKYFHYLDPAPNHEEWYDLTVDPYEQKNRVDDPKVAERVKKIKTRMVTLIEENK